MNKFRSSCVALFISSLILFAACQAIPTPTPVGSSPASTNSPTLTAAGAITSSPTSSAPTSSSTTPVVRRPGGSIIIAGVGTPSHEITALPDFVSSAIYDSLLTFNPHDGSLAPGLAEQWSVSDDAKTFTFMLRQNVKWHDGQPLTADDIVFTLKTLSDPDIRITPAADFGPIGDVTANDARTISVSMKNAYCAALTYIGAVKILPKHVLENKTLTNIAAEDLLGTGPLILKSWNADTLTFTPNSSYWNGAPQITNWTYKIFPNDNAARDAVQQGQADLVVTNTPPSESTDASFPANEFYGLAMNNARTPFDNVQVRRALAMGIDRAAILSAVDAGAQPLDTSLLPTFWASPGQENQPAYDVKQAQQILANNGWQDSDGDGILDKDGKPFEVTLWAQVDEPLTETIAQLLRAELEKIGVRAILKLDDRDLFLTRVFLEEYDLALVHFNIPQDADQHYLWASSEDKPGFGLNITHYENKTVDDALSAGNQVAHCDANARKTAYAPVFSQLATDTPILFLFAPPRVVDATERVQGLEPSSFAGAYWNLTSWTIAQ